MMAATEGPAVVNGDDGIHSVDYGIIPSSMSSERLDNYLPSLSFCQFRLRSVKRHLISPAVLKSFLQGLSVALPVQILLGVVCTYACRHYNVWFDCQMSLFVAPVVFPLAFSINACYQRRDKVLDDLSMFKGAALIIFYCHRDWAFPAGYDHRKFSHRTVTLLARLVKLIKVYLLLESNANNASCCTKRAAVLEEIDQCFSGIASVTEELRGSSLPSSGPLVTRLIHSHNQMCWSFERLRVVREYRTPRSIRSFTKMVIFILPLVLSPYFVYVGENSKAPWAPYYISVLVSTLYGSLQTLQDNLDDPFDGIGEDDINLDTLDAWTGRSLNVAHTPSAEGIQTQVSTVTSCDETDNASVGTADAGIVTYRRLAESNV